MNKSTTKKKKIGRPALPKGEKRTTLSFRASPKEQQQIEAAAGRAGARVTSWVRTVVLAAAGGQ